jgi:hypothetical protein
MADPKAEKMEKKLEDTGAPNQSDELSDADIENVAGGMCLASTKCAMTCPESETP